MHTKDILFSSFQYNPVLLLQFVNDKSFPLHSLSGFDLFHRFRVLVSDTDFAINLCIELKCQILCFLTMLEKNLIQTDG